MRIKASTLLETVASMAIIGCVLSCAGLIFSNVLTSDSSADRTKARLAIDGEVTRILSEASIGTREHVFLGVRVKSTWTPAGHDRREVHIMALDEHGEVLLEQDRSLCARWND